MGDQNIFAAVLDKVRAANEALIADGVLPVGIDQSRIVVEPPRESAHGDMATNAAMVLAKGAGSKPRVMIGFNRRFDPSFRALRERLQRGEIGTLELALITSRDPAPPPAAYIKTSGGLMRDMTIHDFDMARYLAGDIAQVHAFGANLVDPGIGKLGDIDTCSVSLRAKSGALLQINNSRRCVYGYDQRIEAFGSNGMLQAANQYPTTVESWSAERTGAREPTLNFFIERYREAYTSEVDAFVSSLEEGRPMSPDFADGLAALRLAVAAEESLQTGRVVGLD